MDSTVLSRHAAHVLSIAIPVFMLAAGLVWDSVRKRRAAARAAGRTTAGPLLWAAALASVGAASVHVSVVPEHAREWIGYAAFFVVAAVAQVVGAWLLVKRRSIAITSLMAAANAAMIVLWLITRLVAVPIGPGAGEVETFGWLDVTATACELVIVVSTVLWLMKLPRRARVRLRPATLVASLDG